MAIKITHAQKLQMLELISERKTIIFGNNNLTKEEKNNAWLEIFNGAKANGVIFLGGKDTFKYLRDSWWPNIKNPAIVRNSYIFL